MHFSKGNLVARVYFKARNLIYWKESSINYYLFLTSPMLSKTADTHHFRLAVESVRPGSARTAGHASEAPVRLSQKDTEIWFISQLACLKLQWVNPTELLTCRKKSKYLGEFTSWVNKGAIYVDVHIWVIHLIFKQICKIIWIN